MLSITRSSVYDAFGIPCDNCNAALVNTATIQNTRGERFTVGLDCMKTLTGALANLADYEYELYAFNSALRFYGLMEKAENVRIRNGFIEIEYLDKKGIMCSKREFENVLTGYNFDLSKFQRELTAKEVQIDKTISEIQNGKPYVCLEGVIQYRLERYRLEKDGRLMRFVTLDQIEKMLKRIL